MNDENDMNAPRPRLVVKLADAADPQATVLLWSQVQKAYPGVEIERTFPGFDPKNSDTLIAQATDKLLDDRGDTLAPATENLARYYTLKIDPEVDLPRAILDLSERPEVEEVMEEERPSPPPQLVVLEEEIGLLTQLHLAPAPQGIGAQGLERPGGRGQGMGFADLESGWNLDHVDLLDLNLQSPLFGVSCNDREHGTAVLGIVAARGTRDGGVIGIAPELARIEVVSPLRSCFGRREMAQAIRHTAEALLPGDVLLLEAQISFSGVTDIPAEVVPFLADAIRYASNLGIVVIEAAGNKGASLDDLEVPHGRTLNVDHPRFKDSGAIFVAAATADVPHRRHHNTSFGKRIDCYGWGEKVVTCGGRIGNRVTDHTDNFSGTSAAAAMVAGVALCVQGMAKAKSGRPFSPKMLRNILRDPVNGTLPEGGLEAGIGVMPDLAKIARNFLPV